MACRTQHSYRDSHNIHPKIISNGISHPKRSAFPFPAPPPEPKRDSTTLGDLDSLTLCDLALPAPVFSKHGSRNSLTMQDWTNLARDWNTWHTGSSDGLNTSEAEAERSSVSSDSSEDSWRATAEERSIWEEEPRDLRQVVWCYLKGILGCFSTFS